MSNLIFEDLGIETGDTMLADPFGFYSRVNEAAESLKDIMKKNDSLETYIKGIKNVPTSKEADVKDICAQLYEVAENVPLNEIDSIISFAKSLVKDLETLRWYRGGNELALNQNVMDKRTAHEQYMRLREAYNKYAESMSILELADLPKLPSMPGNYGSNVNLKQYIFFFGDETEGFRNHIAVCKRLGIPLGSLVDVLEYIDNNETNVTVKVLSS